jgi:hypothetical protein
MLSTPTQDILDSEAREFYCHTIGVLRAAEVEYLVGGAYAFARYTGIERHTKDFDIFVRPADCKRALDALAAAGYATEVTFAHWLAKAHHGEYFVDLIFASGNGIARVDDEWFEHAVDDLVLDESVRLCPVEEIIWSKAFIQERERFDGADVAHLLLARGKHLDWARLLRRFGPHWRVLFGHLVVFGHIYPSERDRVPSGVLQALAERLGTETSAPPPTERVCRGTLLSRQQYLVDVERWGFGDARSRFDNPMSDDDIARWTAGIVLDGSP